MTFASKWRTAAAAALLAATGLTGASAETMVFIRTSDNVSGAGTASNVYIKLHGPSGVTNRVRLQDELDGNILEKGDVEILVFSENIGPVVTKIELESDGRYAGSDWHLHEITTTTGSMNDIVLAVNPLTAGTPGLQDRLVHSTFSYDDWITGKETYPGESAGRTKRGIE